jgi:hypothetical protein
MHNCTSPYHFPSCTMPIANLQAEPLPGGGNLFVLQFFCSVEEGLWWYCPKAFCKIEWINIARALALNPALWELVGWWLFPYRTLLAPTVFRACPSAFDVSWNSHVCSDAGPHLCLQALEACLTLGPLIPVWPPSTYVSYHTLPGLHPASMTSCPALFQH